MGNVHTMEDLKYYQSLPLNLKIAMSKRRIRDFIREYGESGVCVSVSGKDSSALLHLIREDYPNVKGVFVDTGLEFPSVKECNAKKENVDIVRPEKDFRTVLIEYGYPIIGKEVASKIEEVRSKPNGYARKNFDPGGELAKQNSPYYYGKYRFLIDAPFKISAKCCSKIKKAPLKKYEKKNDLKPFIGTLVEESRIRRTAWLRQGCTVFGKNAKSMPLSFWTENDVLQYIVPYLFGIRLVQVHTI
jgi:3'-phosphoadenosine 5'-phosphosulfate sulfotransferase (PAPS reductase)/FAD synthetase